VGPLPLKKICDKYRSTFSRIWESVQPLNIPLQLVKILNCELFLTNFSLVKAFTGTLYSSHSYKLPGNISLCLLSA
jgi:hypothetical protein